MYKSYWLKVLLALVAVKAYAVTPRFACKNQDGSLDDTFGNHGKVVTPIGDSAASSRSSCFALW